MEKTILCYGDSNTWGYIPFSEKDEGASFVGRYPRAQRWPGILQKLLGENYYVVEEGLNGRTTNVDYAIYPDRNGKTYLPSCLYSHAPVDLVILALGGNDLKSYFNRSLESVTKGLAELIDIIKNSQYGPRMKATPQILVLTVPIPLPIGEEMVDQGGHFVFKDARNRASQLRQYFIDLAHEKGCFFLDIAKQVNLSEIDGLHFDEQGHEVLAQLIYEKVKTICT